MSSKDVAIARAAEHMALRVLLSNVYAEVFRARPERLRELELATSDAADRIDVSGFGENGAELFRHTYLHELETFWQGLALHFPKGGGSRRS